MSDRKSCGFRNEVGSGKSNSFWTFYSHKAWLFRDTMQVWPEKVAPSSGELWRTRLEKKLKEKQREQPPCPTIRKTTVQNCPVIAAGWDLQDEEEKSSIIGCPGLCRHLGLPGPITSSVYGDDCPEIIRQPITGSTVDLDIPLYDQMALLKKKR